MSVAKPSSSGSPNVMKLEEVNDPIEPSIRQDNFQVPVIHLTGTEENMDQWVQLFRVLDQPDLLGWPFMSPVKVPMQKCKKCSLEFCSPINYRRHIRVHRQSSTLNKESNRNKELLAAFWDKLTVEKADEVVSLNEAMLKEIPGSSVITALASSVCNPAVWALPQVYVKAGSSLLNMIKAKPSRLPMASQELFCILDEASERTFLCGGTPESVQNYLFDGEATKTCLQLKNLVASTSFLFEQQLVKAWAAEKDAEALRCQKLLVEEEEAAKKRLAELSERKKQKKLRRKEHKLKELSHQSDRDLNVAVDAAETPVLAQVSEPLSPPDSSSNLIHRLENIESGRESPRNQDKGLEEQMYLSREGITQGETEATESDMVAEPIISICVPENVDSGFETLESPQKNLTRQVDSEEGTCQRECKSNSIYGPVDYDAGPEKDSVSNGVIKQEETETFKPQMTSESNPIYGLEKHDAGHSPVEDVEEQTGCSDLSIFQGDTDAIPSYMVCESNEETGKFYSLTPLNRNIVSKKKDEARAESRKPSLLGGKCGCDHLIEETNFEVLIGSISIKVNLPAFLVGDVVVSEKAGVPIFFCDGGTLAPVLAPYNDCVNPDHAVPAPHDDCGNHDHSVPAPDDDCDNQDHDEPDWDNQDHDEPDWDNQDHDEPAPYDECGNQDHSVPSPYDHYGNQDYAVPAAYDQYGYYYHTVPVLYDQYGNHGHAVPAPYNHRGNHYRAPSNYRQHERITITPASIAAAKEFLARRWMEALALQRGVY